MSNGTFHIEFLYWWNSVGPTRHHTGRCLEKVGEGRSVLVGTEDTTFMLCPLKPHDILKFKWTAWVVRRSKYVPFIPLQLYWQRNPITHCHHFVRFASLLPRRVEFSVMHLLNIYIPCRDLPDTLIKKALIKYRPATLFPFKKWVCVCPAVLGSQNSKIVKRSLRCCAWC